MAIEALNLILDILLLDLMDFRTTSRSSPKGPRPMK